MLSRISRRDFVQYSAAATALTGLGDFRFLAGLPPLSAAQVQVQPAMVQFSPDIEPLVRLIETTPRNQLIEAAAQRVRGGTSYQELLAALLLAGVRSIKPRPVGFQFHAVLVTNSAHLASIAAQDRDRWLPLFWALDNFKTSQARSVQANGWVMPPVDEAHVPAANVARQRFHEAMDNWDVEAADRAVVGLVRSASAGEVIEPFWRYGARDFRDIGHKAIYAANAWRTLHTIGWRHAEPVMRSLAFALLDHEGTNPAQRDADPDRPWRENLQRVLRIRADWQRGQRPANAATDVVQALRTCTPGEGSELMVRLLNQGVDPACLWDGIFLTAGELLMRQPGIVGLHCVTSVNALHFGYTATGNDETRQLLLLQAPAFLVLFRSTMAQRGQLQNRQVDTLERMDPTAQGPQAIEEILTDISGNKVTAARKILGLLHGDANGERARALLAGARRLIFSKGRDSHDYKYSSAALEDFYHMTPAWRNRFLATTAFNLKGATDQDSDLIRRTQAALTA
jgi:hypothetical protein